MSSSCAASGWVREGVVMNFGALPPRVASSQLRRHILLLVLPAPTSTNSNDLCSPPQTGGQRRPQIFTARRRREGCKLSPHHSISPRPAALQHTLLPPRSSIAGAGNAEAWEKTFTLASRCLFFLSHVPTKQQLILPGVPYCSQDTWKKNTGGNRRKGVL